MIYNNIDITNEPYYRYAVDCVSGAQTCCEYTKLACKRFLSDLQRPELLFSAKKVDKVIKFISKLKHFQGKSAGQNFYLEPWQAFVTANIFGFWKYTTDEKTGQQILIRRFNTAYIEMSRKQGKTAIVAAYALYGLMYDNEAAAEIILAATSREQAKICYNLCVGFARSIDPNGKYLHILRTGIEYKKTSSILKVISADSSKQDGFNASYGVVDEYHAHKDSKVYDVINSSQGFRQNPLMLVITTAGFNKEAPCYKMRQTNIEILRNVKQDDGRFAVIYTLDEKDDYKDESTWIKCSPNLGTTVTKEYLRGRVQKAVNDPTEYVNIMTKNFNVWCDSAETWIDDDTIEKVMAGYHVDFEKWRDSPVWIGVDLAAVSDMASVSFTFHEDESSTFETKTFYFLPEDCLKNNSNAEFYKEMIMYGFIIVTPGNVIDYDYIQNLILKNVEEYQLAVQSIFYDRYNATQWAISMTEAGMPMQPFSQSLANFSAPSKQLERLIRLGQITLDNNFVTLWCFRNVVLKRDHNENIKPDKTSNQNKIDGVISIIQSLAAYYVLNGLIPEIMALSNGNG